jgi:Zn-dependent M28 family amino/carboxypeptidase
VFVALTGEEKGLLGSRFFAANPTIDKKSIVANLNTDMFLPIVPLKMITVFGLDESNLGATFKRVAGEHNVGIQPDPEPQTNRFIRSDQYNFIKNGVPALALKFGAPTGTPEDKVLKQWVHDRYHAPSDDLNQPVEIEGAAQFDRIVAAFLRDVANAPDKPSWYPNSFFKRYAQR